MRVLLCVHQFFPDHTLGTERYTLGLARALRVRGHQVLVYTGTSRPEAGSMLVDYEYDEVPVRAVNFAASPPAQFSDHHTRPELLPLHRRVLREFQPDLVHITHFLNLGVELLEACRSAGIPALQTFTDLWGFCWAGQCIRPCDDRLCDGPRSDSFNCVLDLLKSEKTERRNTPLEKALVAASRVGLGSALYHAIRRISPRTLAEHAPDVLSVATRNSTLRETLQTTIAQAIFPSQFLRDAFAANGLVFENSTVLSYGIRQPTGAERDLLRQSETREPGPPVFAFLGQLARHKGLYVLLQAFRAAAIPGAKLKIHGRFNPGDADADSLAREIAQTPGASMEGFFPGEQVYQVLAGCDVVVIPSLWHENAPLALLESLSAGKPVIIADGKGMLEFVNDGETGLVTRTGSVDSLRDALLRFHRMTCRLPGISADQPAYRMSPDDHVETLLQHHYQRLARPFVPEASGDPSDQGELGHFIQLEPLVTPQPVTDGGAIAWRLSSSKLRGCEVRLPTPGLSMKANSRGSKPKPLSAAATDQSVYGKTFPRRFPDDLSLRIQKKPFISLWGRKNRMVQVKWLRGFDSAEYLTISARAKLSRRSSLRVRGMHTGPDGRPRKVEQTWSWNWPVQGWTRARLHLAGLRANGWSDLQVDWIPVDTRKAWKLDLLEFHLGSLNGDVDSQKPRHTTAPPPERPVDPHLMDWSTIPDPRGDLTVAEFPSSLPFVPQRIYWIYGIPAGTSRGGHAHREVDEIVVPVSGGFTVSLQARNGEKREFHLTNPREGLFLPHGWWREIRDYQPHTVCMVMSSGPYEEAEYIRDSKEFFAK